MSANWFVTKDVKPEDKMPNTNWVWVVDPCHLCPKSGNSGCKPWEACMRKKRGHPDPKLRHPTPKLRRVKKSELNPRTDHACVMQSDGDTIAWDGNTKCWVPCDQCWSLAQCIENDHALERKAIAFLNIYTPGVTPAKRACKNGVSGFKSPTQECKTPGKDTGCHDPKRARPSPGKPLRPPAETPSRHSRLNAPQRNLVASSTGSSAPPSGRDSSPGSGLPKVGAVNAYESSGVNAVATTNGRISRETVAGNRVPGHLFSSPRSPIHPKSSSGEKNTNLVRGRQASGKNDDTGKRVTWNAPLASRGGSDSSSSLPGVGFRMQEGLSPNGTAGERVTSWRLEDSFAPDAGSAVDVIPPPADESTVSPDDEQAAASDSRAGEVSGPPSETQVTGAVREEVAPQMSIEALREWARVEGGKVEDINQNLNGVEQLISTTNADMKRLRIVLSAADKKQAEMIRTQHACMAKSAAARRALSKALKKRAKRSGKTLPRRPKTLVILRRRCGLWRSVRRGGGGGSEEGTRFMLRRLFFHLP